MRTAVSVFVLTLAVAVATPAAAGAATVRAAANKVLVTTADLPAGWTASAHDSEGEGAAAKNIARCVGTPVAKKKVVVTGDDITRADGNAMVTSAVTVYPSTAIAKKQFAVFQSKKYDDCAQKHFETTPMGGTGGALPTSVDVARITLDRYGSRSVAYGLQAQVPATDGTSVDVSSVQVAVLEGRAIARYLFNGQGEVFDEATGKAVLEKLDTRLGNSRL